MLGFAFKAIYTVCRLLVWIFGVLAIAKYGFEYGLPLVELGLAKYTGPVRRIHTLGKWAVITGASDGIGKGLAFELVSKGMNIVIVGRDREKLNVVEGELNSLGAQLNNGVKVESIVKDLDTQSEAIFHEFAAKLEEYNADGGIGLFINNAGISYPSALRYEELDITRMQSIINLNLYAQMRMTHVVYSLMIRKHRGAIVCVGSGSGSLPSDPLYAAYSASKAGIAAFCENLRIEAASNNIIIQCHAPLLVPTKLSKVRGGALVAPIKEYCELAIASVENQYYTDNTIGGISLRSPYIPHMLVTGLANMLPRPLWDYTRYTMNKTIRSRYIKKLNEEENVDITVKGNSGSSTRVGNKVEG